LNIATGITTGNINIGSATGTNKINIGGVLVGVNAINASTDAIFQIANTNINTSISIGGSQTSGPLNIGSGNTRSGTINIANGTGSTCPINILNGGGATTGGSVNIANGALQTTTVNIASGTGTGLVTIGNVSNTTTIGSGTVNVNGNLIMGTGRNITLQPSAGYIAPSSITQLGGYVEVPITSSISITSSSANFLLITLTIGTPGIYIINYAFRYQGTGTTSCTFIQTWFNTSNQSGNSATIQYASNAYTNTTGQSLTVPVFQSSCAFVTVTSTSTITFYCFVNYTGSAPVVLSGNSYYSYMRIA
jgi:hypothetical protein